MEYMGSYNVSSLKSADASCRIAACDIAVRGFRTIRRVKREDLS